jgi:plastocyanin
VNGECVYPPAGTINITVGTKVRFMNTSTTTTGTDFNIHADGNSYGCGHQDTSLRTLAGDAYECTIQNADGASFTYYCHAPGPNLGSNNRRILPVP